MVKRSENYRNAAQEAADGVPCSPLEAICFAKRTSTMKLNATIEVAFRLGIGPRRANQTVRGIINLPHGIGKTARILVFVIGPHAQEAIDAGTDEVGSDELIEKVAGGYTGFDAAVATLDLTGKVGHLGRVLNPRDLISNPKMSTVTMDVAKAVSDIRGGRIEFRVGKNDSLSFVVGEAPFAPERFAENYAVVQEEVLRPKPSTSKGHHLLKGMVAATMGPGILLDTSKTRNLTSKDPS